MSLAPRGVRLTARPFLSYPDRTLASTLLYAYGAAPLARLILLGLPVCLPRGVSSPGSASQLSQAPFRTGVGAGVPGGGRIKGA